MSISQSLSSKALPKPDSMDKGYGLDNLLSSRMAIINENEKFKAAERVIK